MNLSRKAAIGGLVVMASASQASFFDDFNRADSAGLGANWTALSGQINVTGNQAAGTGMDLSGVVGESAAYTNAYARVDAICTGTNLQYVALMIGMNGSGSDGIFVKLQQQSSTGGFEWAAFYLGENGISGSFGLGFFSLGQSIPAARMSVYALNADTIRLALDTNFDGNTDLFYDSSGVSAYTGGFGTGFGLGMYGSDSRADNYGTSPVPEPASLAALGLGALALLRRRR